MTAAIADAITAIAGGVRIAVRAQPRASREAIVGAVDDGRGGAAIKIAVTAPPVEGAANDAIARVLAAALGVPRRAVVVARGESGRNKLVDVAEVDREAAVRLLAER